MDALAPGAPTFSTLPVYPQMGHRKLDVPQPGYVPNPQIAETPFISHGSSGPSVYGTPILLQDGSGALENVALTINQEGSGAVGYGAHAIPQQEPGAPSSPRHGPGQQFVTVQNYIQLPRALVQNISSTPQQQHPDCAHQYATTSDTLSPRTLSHRRHKNKGPRRRAENYLGLNILAFICCCWPIAIFGIIESVKSLKAVKHGDMSEAYGHAECAKWSAITAMILGSAVIIAIITLSLLLT